MAPLAGPVRDAVVERLRLFTPSVESLGSEGVFWLDADGLEALYPSLRAWGERILQEVKSLGFEAGLAVGFSRFGAFAAARSEVKIALFDTEEEEASFVGQVPLRRLFISEEALCALERLGKRTVADLLSLPACGIRERFSEELYRVHRLASGALWDPVIPDAKMSPIQERWDLDYPEEDSSRLVFIAKRLIGSMLFRASERCLAVSGLILELGFHKSPPSSHRLKPAEPTLDEMQLVELVRLRLETLALSSGVESIAMEALTAPAFPKQLEMFEKKPLRDLRAADRALARLAAELGPEAVVRAVIKKGHLPEARYAFETISSARSPSVDAGEEPDLPALVRRVFLKPVPLQKAPVVGPRGCHLRGMAEAPATRVIGPYAVFGGWWAREVHREYYFAETEAGEVLWVYYDRRKRSWFLQGEVE